MKSAGVRKIDVAVVGAGIIGICAAVNLVEAGRSVTLFDRTGVCEETSAGNAAAFAFSDVLPLAQKGMMRQLPGWLRDPLGPLTVSPSYLPRLMPWLFRFWRAGWASNHDRSVAAQAALMRLAEQEWLNFLDRSGTRTMLREHGALELYESEAEFRAALPGWDVRERHGIAFRHVEGTELAELQPGLSPRFVKATFVPGWKNVSDPKQLGKAIFEYGRTLEGRLQFEQRCVAQVEANSGGGAQLRFADGETLSCKTLVIAAGAWSHLLAAQLGERIPLETERGYNTTLPASSFDVKRQLIFPGHGFVITPLEGGLRVGGAVEFAGLERAPNYARAKAMLAKAQAFLPGLDSEGGREWMGFRPSLPDSLPVIGHARLSRDIIYASGHGHLGLTQAAATGRLVRDLAEGNVPPLDLSSFSPRRF